MGAEERKEKEKELRRKDIIDAAERVFFSKGYDVATMDDVARTAEFSKRTVYVYFKSKEQIYFEIMIRGYKILIQMIEDYDKKLSNDAGIYKIRKLGLILFEFSKQYEDYFSAIMNYENGEMDFSTGVTDRAKQECYELGERIFDYLICSLKQGIEDGTIDNSVDITNTALVLWSCTLGIFNTLRTKKRYIMEYHQRNAEELLEEAFDMLTKAIRK
ncbi:TetR/AcrR family transcriptional regulator [Clostridium folliculivorans]|uniref:AcrR family transcriptional regulator n=1 Tax=Clostridium folliculivorans TaxID=2886038 RepID=A0A9W5Y227_9CLOT|nr:TetR/AcrR family transcriptional regulator [Clostridium folliculivorans]GKU25062.1 AcrR family transcriptional regulator [Clostridium folliculivorans]GKU31160.1 AcrR family transcriptional regulator [Clostridium folliculivorans]